MKVLLIDDEKSFHKIMEILSKKFCFELICVSTIEDAKKVCDDLVDLVIIDYELPDGNGLLLNTFLKNKFDKIETVLCTGYEELLTCNSSDSFDFTLRKDGIVPFIGEIVQKCTK